MRNFFTAYLITSHATRGRGISIIKWVIIMMILSSIFSCGKAEIVEVNCYECISYTTITADPENASYPINDSSGFPWCGPEEDLKFVEIETSGATEFTIDNILYTITTEQYTVCVKE